eukprot:TRINITY_DN61816_c0_g1_i1.p1 TRINITY_DN61816_c0_g1~~TRINITY_DN61816_c0_g1_i1.p1  ORF type:complete len:306 (-),score=47.65 TRINITY_DN61816_c0_g1_i1:253-1170(-)
MNSFAALMVDSDDEDTQKVANNKKNNEKKNATTKTNKVIPGATKNIPGMAKKQTATIAFSSTATEPPATDPVTQKVNDRGGREKEKYGSKRHSNPGESRAHARRHDYDITGRGKDSTRGGRGPGNWGSPEEEARRAEKNREEVNDNVEENQDDEEEKVVEEEKPTVFGFDDYLARRNEMRSSNSELFGNTKERVVKADASLKELKKGPAEEETQEVKGTKKVQRSNVKTNLDVSFTVSSKVDVPPRERDNGRNNNRGRGDNNRGRGGRGDNNRGRGDNNRGRGDNRGRGGRGGQTKLNNDDFPAL